MLNDGPLPPEFATAAGPALGEERVLWWTPGNPWRTLWRTLPIWGLAIPWTVFTLYVETIMVTAILHGDGGSGPPRLVYVVMALFLLIFLAVGLILLAKPVHAAMKAARSIHVLTPTRIVRITRGASIEVQSIPLAGIVDVTHRRYRDGTGRLTLSFGRVHDGDGHYVDKTEVIDAPANVATLDSILRAALAGQQRPA